MTKKSSTTRSLKPTKPADRLRRFSAALSDQAVIDASAGIFIIVLLSLLLLRSYERPQIPQLPVGSIAPMDILAPEDLKVEDPAESERMRAQAAAAVLPVFDFSPRAGREVRVLIEKVFAVGREADPEISLVELGDKIEAETGVILDDEQVSMFVRHRFNYELQNLMIDHLESVMTLGVVSSRSQLARLGAAGITRRDPRNNSETVVTDLSPLRDLLTARAELRSEKLILPSDYDARERRLIGEILGSVVVPNLEFNEFETEARRQAMRETMAPVTFSVSANQPIVVRGETVTTAKAELLEAAATRLPGGRLAIEFAGTVVLVMMLVLVLWQYLVRYQNRHVRVRRHFLLQIATFVVTLGLVRALFSFAYAMSHWSDKVPFNSQMSYRYLAPIAVGAALVTILTDSHAAFVFSAILAVFVGLLSGDIHLAVYALVSGVAALYYLQNCRDRTELVRAGLWIGLVNAAAALALDLLGANELLASTPAGWDWLWIALYDAACAFAGGVLASMVASILLPLFEWLFAITTNIKLLELSNLNLPLLKQLAEQAPGTYHHSIMVGLLASKAAEAIGGDALFARVACLYHDIGKSVRPTYFIENQTFAGNPHDRLEPKMSSIILANHVKQGIELAQAHKLPPRVVAVIPQHHGTGLMKYFYYKARTTAPDPESAALEQEFRYPGPKPQTKEAGIIMIADSVEAASRTVQEPTPAKLGNMIDMIIARIRDDGQLDECDLTLRELSLVADSFVKTLLAIQHHRVSYPGYDFNRPGEGAPLPPRSIREHQGADASGAIPELIAATDVKITPAAAKEAHGD